MKKILLSSVLLGAAITIVLTYTTVKLEWGAPETAICPGQSYSIEAIATAGFPNESTATVPAMGTCGEVTSKLTISGLMKLLLTTETVINFCIWSVSSFGLLFAIHKLRATRQ